MSKLKKVIESLRRYLTGERIVATYYQPSNESSYWNGRLDSYRHILCVLDESYMGDRQAEFLQGLDATPPFISGRDDWVDKHFRIEDFTLNIDPNEECEDDDEDCDDDEIITIEDLDSL